MARMIPDIDLEQGSRGESKLHESLRVGLSDDFRVFANLVLTTINKGRVREREIDFLILHRELGFLLIEVKGGEDIRYDPKRARWISTDLAGKEHVVKDPFKQASVSMHALTREMGERGIFPEERFPFVHGHAVAFPDAAPVTKYFPPHAKPELIIDFSHLPVLQERIESIYALWKGEREHRSMGENDYHNLLNKFLMPECRLAYSVAARMGQEEQQLVRLTEEQFGYLKLLREQKRALFKGYAGTGKTQLAMEKARQLAFEGQETLFLCYNTRLAKYLSQSFRVAPGLHIDSYHNLARGFIDAADLPWPEEGQPLDKRFWEEEVPARLRDALAKVPKRYDAVIIDEGQDFMAVWFESILRLLKEPDSGCLYIFYDDMQNIYGGGLRFPVEGPPFVLYENCRNTQNICECTRALGKIDEESYTAEKNPRGEEVHWLAYKRPEQQPAMMEKVIRSLLKKGLNPAQIIILAPRKKENGCLATADSLAGCPLAEYEPGRDAEAIRFCTTKGFKGLESDVVILCDMDGKFPMHTPADRCVATSRAKHILYVLHSQEWQPDAKAQNVSAVR